VLALSLYRRVSWVRVINLSGHYKFTWPPGLTAPTNPGSAPNSTTPAARMRRHTEKREPIPPPGTNCSPAGPANRFVVFDDWFISTTGSFQLLVHFNGPQTGSANKKLQLVVSIQAWGAPANTHGKPQTPISHSNRN